MRILNKNTQTTEIAQNAAMTGILINLFNDKVKGVGIEQIITVTTPSAGAFTAAVTDICTKTAHGFKDGLKVQVSSSVALPTGLVAVTDYFVIVLDANTFKLASSLANAIALTGIDISSTGTGTHTVTPTALAGCNVKYQGSIDGTNWVDLQAATNITATVNLMYEKLDPMFEYMRAYFTMTAGQISITQYMITKGQ